MNRKNQRAFGNVTRTTYLYNAKSPKDAVKKAAEYGKLFQTNYNESMLTFYGAPAEKIYIGIDRISYCDIDQDFNQITSEYSRGTIRKAKRNICDSSTLIKSLKMETPTS